jgi:hypothetical protein
MHISKISTCNFTYEELDDVYLTNDHLIEHADQVIIKFSRVDFARVLKVTRKKKSMQWHTVKGCVFVVVHQFLAQNGALWGMEIITVFGEICFVGFGLKYKNMYFWFCIKYKNVTWVSVTLYNTVSLPSLKPKCATSNILHLSSPAKS